MSQRNQSAEFHRRRGATNPHGARWHVLATLLAFILVASASLSGAPAHAQSKLASAFQVMLTERFFGTQALSVKPVDFSHPDHAQFTITNASELWYSVRVDAASDALRPVAANPGADLVSAAMVESGLLMPSGIIPLNPDLSLFQKVTLESHFTAPNQTVSIELNPFTFDAGAFDCVRLALMLVGQHEIADEAGIVVPGAIKEVVQDFHNAKGLTALVNDFVKLLTAVEQGQSLLGPAHAVFGDLLQVANDGAELGILASALGKVVGRHVNVNPLKVVLGILDGAKYLTDLTRSFGAYLFLNGNYPTITLQTVAKEPPASYPQSQWTLGSNLLWYIAAGADGDMWFPVGDSSIGRISPEGQMTVFPLPSAAGSSLLGITPGPDDTVWFTDFGKGEIGRITHDGKVAEFSLGGGSPKGITAGPDGNLWFVDADGQVGRITLDGQVTEFPIPTPNSLPFSIAAGPDGNLWFTELDGEQIGRVTPDGQMSEFPLPTPGSEPTAITTGPDGNLWFTETTVDPNGVQSGTRIGRITPNGQITEFAVPTSEVSPEAITTGPDGNLWFVDWGAFGHISGDVGRITPRGSLTFPIPGLQGLGLISLTGIATGWDGYLWLTGEASDDGGNTGHSVIVRIKP